MNPARARYFTLLQCVKTNPEGHKTCSRKSTEVSLGGVRLISHLHLVVRLKSMKLYFEHPCVLVAWCLIKHRGSFAFAVNFTFAAFDIMPFSEGKACMMRNRVLDSARKQYFILWY
jgi:hypothetical protein